MDIISWIVFGGLAGWIATIIVGADARFGIIGNIIIGIVGAALGGWLAGKMGNQEGVSGFNFRSFIIAIVGSVVLLWVINLLF